MKIQPDRYPHLDPKRAAEFLFLKAKVAEVSIPYLLAMANVELQRRSKPAKQLLL